MFIHALLGSVIGPLAAEVQQVASIPRIGHPGDQPEPRPGRGVPSRTASGYVEGRNLVIESRNAETTLERLPALAAELVALKVDVLVTAGGTPAALAAKQASSTLPIVFADVGDPVTAELVTSLARPGPGLRSLNATVRDQSAQTCHPPGGHSS